MYKCYDCGHIFDKGEEEKWFEVVGEYGGRSCLEELVGCPLCRGQFGVTEKCAICGSEHLSHVLHGDVCDECVDLYKHDIDICFEIGKKYKESIELNCFLSSVFSKEEIEEILLQHLKESPNQDVVESDCEKFVFADVDWFAGQLAKEVRNNENAKG